MTNDEAAKSHGGAMKKRFSIFAAAVFLLTGSLLAQGNQTGELTGTARASDGTALPGVTVTIESPALQGRRTQSTGANGDYVFKFLPPGSYTVRFELAGMRAVLQQTTVDLGKTVRADATLAQAVASEAVTVTAGALDAEATAVHSTNFDDRQVQQLPISPAGRTIDQIAALAPEVTQNTPNANQLQINGGFSYDNVFLVDGVDIDDHYFGSPTNNLVIEDAVQETQVLTSNISAEYGRFSGGVVNAVTKTGGNTFHGSGRVDMTNDNWRANTPFENDNGVHHPSQLNDVFTGTLGGKLLTDRLWFFAAGRYFDTSTQVTLPETGETITQTDKEPRLEFKLTGNLNESHSIQAAYTYSKEELQRVAFPFSIDPNGIEHPNFPSSLIVGTYHGVLSSSLFATAQYSQKKFEFKGSGGTSPDIHDSPIICSTLALCAYNAPYFDATDPEQRNNQQYAGSLNYFATTQKLGSHDLKVGAEYFKVTEIGGNSQSATNFTFYADYLQDANGHPVIQNGRLVPLFNDNTLLLSWVPLRGAEAQLKTTAVYFNDAWRITPNLSANLGVRYEHVTGDGPGNASLTSNHVVVPRLGVSYDVDSKGHLVLSGSYGQYAGGSNPNNFLNTTNVANPDVVLGFYTGPPGQGRDFNPGFDPANYQTFQGFFPTVNVQNAGGLRSPVVTEWTASAGTTFGSRSSAAVTYINRKHKNFIDDFITRDLGTTDVIKNGTDFGEFDNRLYRNTDLPQREFQAVAFQSRFGGFFKNLQTDVNYTYMIKDEGNIEGEGSNQPARTSLFGDYPEIYVPDRNFPVGRLLGYQKHKLRILNAYSLPTGAGNFTFGLVYRFDSGTAYDLVALQQPLSDIQIARDPGYANLPANQPLYFGGRGTQVFPSQSRFDFALNYDIPIWKALSPWVKVQLFNVFNTKYRTGFDTTIVPCTKAGDGSVPAGCAANPPLDSNGLPTTFVPGSSFGNARGTTDYQAAREIQLSAGIRF
jgi:outer membrane receptor protein involved in Fe transport